MSTITDLIQQLGAAKAGAIAARGQIYGGVVKGLGDLATDSYKQRLQQQQLAKQNEAQDQQIAASKSQVTLAKNQDTREASAFSSQQAAQQRATEQALHAQTVQALGAVRGASPDQQQGLWTQTRIGLINRGIAKPDEVPAQYPGNDAVDAELRGLMTVKEQWDTAHPKLEMIPRGGAAIDPNTRQVVATGPPAAPPSAKPMEQQLLEAEQVGNKPLAAQIRSVMNARDVNMAPKDESAVSLTPEGLDAAAMMFAKTGQLPPMGMGKQAAEARTRIINRAAVLIPGLDIATAKADFSSNQGSLNALKKQRDAISSFEQTAIKNIDIFLDQAKKVVDTGSPLLNAPLRAISGQILGAADPAAYNAARQVAINEIAKITGNPNLSGQLSDAARHEVEAFNPQSATLKQTVAVMKLLKQDMANRAGSMDQQIAAIRERIKKGQTPEPPVTPTAPTAPADPLGILGGAK